MHSVSLHAVLFTFQCDILNSFRHSNYSLRVPQCNPSSFKCQQMEISDVTEGLAFFPVVYNIVNI